jgi:hypothetical protein
MFRIGIVVAATLTLVTSLQAQGSWCSTRDSQVPVDSLRALVLKHHPNALRASASRDSVLVAFVLDSSCRVLMHAVGRYQADRLGVENLLTTVLPHARLQPFIIAGIAEATDASGAGTPWIVWVSRRT